MNITAKIICDSISPHSPRLTTFLTHYPKFIHAEHMRHSSGSYCVSSSRAIPVSRNLEIVRSDELRAAPVFWGAEQKGMSPGGELSADVYYTSFYVDYPITAKQAAKEVWKKSALEAADKAEYMVKLGVHKSIVNRLLDPFLPVNVLVTSCQPGLLNFFGLRLDKAADPTIRALAEAMWRGYKQSKPETLMPGQWHLPFVSQEDWSEFNKGKPIPEYGPGLVLGHDMLKVSTARCARLSYMSYETGKVSTIAEDLALYNRLIESRPIHASPAEHQAAPDEWWPNSARWAHPSLHGNLPGWIQFRKTLPGEAQAELPEGYQL